MRAIIWTAVWFGLFQTDQWRISVFNLPTMTREQIEVHTVIWLIIGSIYLFSDITRG